MAIENLNIGPGPLTASVLEDWKPLVRSAIEEWAKQGRLASGRDGLEGEEEVLAVVAPRVGNHGGGGGARLHVVPQGGRRGGVVPDAAVRVPSSRAGEGRAQTGCTSRRQLKDVEG